MQSAKLVNVPADGACYYHAVYQSLKAQNLLDRVCDIFGFPSNESHFIQAMKQFIVTEKYDEYKRQYADFFDRVCSMIQLRNTDLHDVKMSQEGYDYMLSQIIEPLPRSLIVLLVKHIKNKAQEKRAEKRATVVQNGKAAGLSERDIFQHLKKMKLLDEVKFTDRKYEKQQRNTACVNFEPFFKDVCLNLPLNSYWATWIETDMVKDAILAPCGISIYIFAKESPNLSSDKRTLTYVYNENSIYLYNDFSHYQYFDFKPAVPSQVKKSTAKQPYQVIVIDDDEQEEPKYPVQPVMPVKTFFQPPKPAKKVNPNLYPCPYMCKKGPCKNRSIDPGRCGTHRFML